MMSLVNLPFLSLLSKRGLFLLAGFFTALGALVFLAWLSEEVLEGDTRQFDDYTSTLIHQHASDPITTLMQGVTFMGSIIFLLACCGVIIIGFIYVRWWPALALLVVTMGGGFLLDVLLKLIFQRPRPVSLLGTPIPHSYSYPSGHALLSFCFYGVLAFIIKTRSSSRAIRLSAWLMTVLLVTLIGFSRIYLGVHYASDVLAGYSTAFIWIATVLIGCRIFFPSK
jgi:membrane-associated phospholipid phosphatase